MICLPSSRKATEAGRGLVIGMSLIRLPVFGSQMRSCWSSLTPATSSLLGLNATAPTIVPLGLSRSQTSLPVAVARTESIPLRETANSSVPSGLQARLWISPLCT